MITFTVNDQVKEFKILQVDDITFYIEDFCNQHSDKIASKSIQQKPYIIKAKPEHFFDLMRELATYNLKEMI